MQLKMYFFIPFVCPCMHHIHNYGAISERHACRDIRWPIILDAGLHTTCRGEQVLVVIRFQCTFLPLRPCKIICTSFLNDAENLATYGCVLWCSQIVYTCPYSLNTTTAFYFMTECLDITVHATILPCFTWPWPELDIVSYSGCSVAPSVTS